MAPATVNQQLSRQLSFTEHVSLLYALIAILGSGLYHMVTGIFRGSHGATKYRLHVGRAMFRTLSSRLSWKQLQYIFPPTNEVYDDFAKKRGLEPNTVKLEHGGLGHWIGEKTAEDVVVYFHGGGFQVSADPVLFDVYSRMITDINSQGHSLAFFFLTYSLTPHASYPTQLRQCVEALRYIVIRTGRLPSNVFIGGDSAGGNLALAVLLHLSHPQPDIEPLDISHPLAGIFTIAPWGCLRLDGWPSEEENRYKDLFLKQAGDKWAQAYLNDRLPDFWTDPFLAPDEWWCGARVKHILILAGSEEILLSQIENFVPKLKKQVPGTVFAVGLHEGHVSPIFDRILGERSQTKQETELRTWLAEILGQKVAAAQVAI